MFRILSNPNHPTSYRTYMETIGKPVLVGTGPVRHGRSSISPIMISATNQLARFLGFGIEWFSGLRLWVQGLVFIWGFRVLNTKD